MADIIKRVLRKILSKFNIPKIIVDDKPDKEIALFGEVNTENNGLMNAQKNCTTKQRAKKSFCTLTEMK